MLRVDPWGGDNPCPGGGTRATNDVVSVFLGTDGKCMWRIVGLGVVLNLTKVSCNPVSSFFPLGTTTRISTLAPGHLSYIFQDMFTYLPSTSINETGTFKSTAHSCK